MTGENVCLPPASSRFFPGNSVGVPRANSLTDAHFLYLCVDCFRKLQSRSALNRVGSG